MTNCIELQGVCKSYGDFALQDLNLTLPGGAIMGLIGENGAGKTTAIKCILGMTRPDSGTVTVLGQPMGPDSAALRQEIGVVLDECFFHDTLRPKDLSPILAPIYRGWDRELYWDCLARYGLPENKLIREFSRGMKMKLSLAAALAHRPRLLVLDEATAGLDPVVRDEILDEFLAFISDEDHAILMSSHITSDLEKIADYVTFLHAGKLLLTKPKDELLWKYGVLRCGEEQFQKLDGSEVLAWQKKDYSYDVLVPDREELLRRYPEAVVDRATMDEILLLYVKGAQKK